MISTAMLVYSVLGAAAAARTSPLVVAAAQQPFEIGASGSPTDLGTMQSAFEQVVVPAASSCGFDAYVFVRHPQVSSNDINNENMPFLTHLVERSEGRYLQPRALEGDNSVFETYAGGVERAIERRCDALPIAANPFSDKPFEPYTDTKPRVISLELPESFSLSEADNVIKRVVGYLPSRNFLLAYRTTPSDDEEDSSDEISEEPKRADIFSNYAFFSPAIFMGLIAVGVLISVFVVGLSAAAGLQITPAAFEQRQDLARKTQ